MQLREMARVLQKENLFLVWSDDFFFFTWKFEESDLNSSNSIKSPNFKVQGRELFIRMSIINVHDDEPILNLYIPGSVEKRHIVIIVSDEANSIIHNKVHTHKGLERFNLLHDFEFLPSHAKYPFIITCISKDLGDLAKESLIHPLDSAHLNSLMELSSDLKKALDPKMHSDAVLKVNGDLIKAHKVILRARSPVFQKMFSNDSLEAAENEVVISDIGAETMKRLISYMYTGAVEKFGFEENLELFYAADKYEMLSLRDICKTELLNLLQVDNACTLFALAVRHSDGDLKEQVVQFASANFKSVVDSESFALLGIDDMTVLTHLCASAMKNQSH